MACDWNLCIIQSTMVRSWDGDTLMNKDVSLCRIRSGRRRIKRYGRLEDAEIDACISPFQILGYIKANPLSIRGFLCAPTRTKASYIMAEFRKVITTLVWEDQSRVKSNSSWYQAVAHLALIPSRRERRRLQLFWCTCVRRSVVHDVTKPSFIQRWYPNDALIAIILCSITFYESIGINFDRAQERFFLNFLKFWGMQRHGRFSVIQDKLASGVVVLLRFKCRVSFRLELPWLRTRWQCCQGQSWSRERDAWEGRRIECGESKSGTCCCFCVCRKLREEKERVSLHLSLNRAVSGRFMKRCQPFLPLLSRDVSVRFIHFDLRFVWRDSIATHKKTIGTGLFTWHSSQYNNHRLTPHHHGFVINYLCVLFLVSFSTNYYELYSAKLLQLSR